MSWSLLPRQPLRTSCVHRHAVNYVAPTHPHTPHPTLHRHCRHVGCELDSGSVEGPAAGQSAPQIHGSGEGPLWIEPILGGSSESAMLVSISGWRPSGTHPSLHPFPPPHAHSLSLLFLHQTVEAGFSGRQPQIPLLGAPEGGLQFQYAIIEGAGSNIGPMRVGADVLNGGRLTSRYSV